MEPTDEAQGDEGQEPVTVTLAYPITLKGKGKHASETTIEELTFRPVTGRDMRYMPTKDDQKLFGILWLAGKLSGQSDRVIDRLQGPDLKKVLEVTNGFLEDSQEDGAESSDT